MFKKVYEKNKAIFLAGAIVIVLALGVLFKVKDEVTRFTLIMPVFAGFILFSILVTPDEELEDNPKKVDEDQEKKKPTHKTEKK